MKVRTTARLLVACCALVAAIAVVRLRESSADRGRGRGSEWLLSRTTEGVRAFRVERAGFAAECVREGGAWRLSEPLAARADDGTVGRLLGGLEQLRRVEVITASQMRQRQLGLADYGLLEPAARIVLREGLAATAIRVGAVSPVGDTVYVSLEGDSNVVATARGLLDLVPSRLEALRDRTLLTGEPARAVRLEIRRPDAGFVQLSGAGGVWTLQQPVVARADTPRVNGLLDALFATKVRRFIWDAPAPGTIASAAASGAREETYGLAADSAAARIAVWVKGDDAGSELFLGKVTADAPGEVYARKRDGESVFTVEKALLDLFGLSLNDLRDRRLFGTPATAVRWVCVQEGDARMVFARESGGGWRVREPAQWNADSALVDELVRRLSDLRVSAFRDDMPTDYARYGLAPPPRSIQLAAIVPAAPAGGAAERPGIATNGGDRLVLGALTDANAGVLARMDSGTGVFEIRAAEVQALGIFPLDPLSFVDRTMLAVPAADVRRLALRRDAVEQRVERLETGGWTATAPAGASVSQPAVDAIVTLAGRLRALRIEGRNIPNLAAYGLSEPRVMLTLGMSGGDSIQKTILFGFRARTEGVYAMVQGQDLVFVLGKEAAERLTQDLVGPGEPAARTP